MPYRRRSGQWIAPALRTHHQARTVRRVDSGSWADWVNAIGTYLAVAGAVFAGIVALRSYRNQQAATDRQLTQQSDDEQRRLEREHRELASKTAVWFFKGTYIWAVHIVNSSGLPVFNVTTLFTSTSPPFSVAVERGTQGPTEPIRSVTLTNALRYILEEHDGLNMDPANLKMEAVFTDAAGARWRRDPNGMLHEAPQRFDFASAESRLIERELPRDEAYLNKRRPPLAEYPPPAQ